MLGVISVESKSNRPGGVLKLPARVQIAVCLPGTDSATNERFAATRSTLLVLADELIEAIAVGNRVVCIACHSHCQLIRVFLFQRSLSLAS